MSKEPCILYKEPFILLYCDKRALYSISKRPISCQKSPFVCAYIYTHTYTYMCIYIYVRHESYVYIHMYIYICIKAGVCCYCAYRVTHSHNGGDSRGTSMLPYTATHWNTLQHTAAHHTEKDCNTLQHTDTHTHTMPAIVEEPTSVLQHAATHWNTLQHTAAHCNTSTTWWR